ncbi:MAG: DUF6644 family protein [Halioglobus sp.]|nr:DUF6644 family protein [Halioglobus sp.]
MAPSLPVPPYPRTVAVCAAIATGLWFALSDLRVDLWVGLLPFFEWLETTPLGVIGKTWGAAFAVVQAVHLLAMAALGGTVLVADGQLLGLVFRDRPLPDLQRQCDRLFDRALVLVVLTGVFMVCAVAVKVYYLEVFWYKMLALASGVLFVYLVRRPLLRCDGGSVAPATRRLVGVASLMIWFSVAATGRWIGFSG